MVLHLRRDGADPFGADPRNVHIVLDGLPLPKPITNGGGFQPEVEPWQPVEIDIEM